MRCAPGNAPSAPARLAPRKRLRRVDNRNPVIQYLRGGSPSTIIDLSGRPLQFDAAAISQASSVPAFRLTSRYRPSARARAEANGFFELRLHYKFGVPEAHDANKWNFVTQQHGLLFVARQETTPACARLGWRRTTSEAAGLPLEGSHPDGVRFSINQRIGAFTNAATSRAALASTPDFCKKPRSRNQSMKRICQVPKGIPVRSGWAASSMAARTSPTISTSASRGRKRLAESWQALGALLTASARISGQSAVRCGCGHAGQWDHFYAYHEPWRHGPSRSLRYRDRQRRTRGIGGIQRVWPRVRAMDLRALTQARKRRAIQGLADPARTGKPA